jgi:hypothetical protein
MARSSSGMGSGGNMKGIATALAKAQANMGKAIKANKNDHFRSKYADLGNVMDACLPALNEVGIALIQPVGTDERGNFVETILIHGESGEQLSCRVPLILGKNDMQGFGSAVTYARRYGLMAMAGIAPEDDDGNAAAASAPKGASAPKPMHQPKLQPAESVDEAIERAAEYLSGAEGLEDLKERWRRIPKPLQAAKEVIAAKDKAKERLTEINDEIPY